MNIVKHYLFAVLVLLAGCAPNIRGDLGARAGSAFQRLPGQWLESVTDGVARYTNARYPEALTVAVYALAPADDEGRVALLRHAAELRRTAERKLSGGQVAFSPVAHKRSGRVLQAQYTGVELRNNRRFVSLAIGTPQHLRSLYYEAIGLSEPLFARRAEAILASVGVHAGALCVARCGELLPAALPAAARDLPRLMPRSLGVVGLPLLR